MSNRRRLRTRTPEQPAVDETAFSLNTWLENSKRMTGQPRYVIVGATSGRDKDETYTRSQMKELVRRFLSLR